MNGISYNERERADFMTYLGKIKSFGYRVRMCNSSQYNYAYIIDEHNVVGYCEKNRYVGINLGTKHHPNRNCGTGFNVEDMVTLDKLTKGLVLRCFCIVPQGYSHRYIADVKKVIIDDGSKESERMLENTIEI